MITHADNILKEVMQKNKPYLLNISLARALTFNCFTDLQEGVIDQAW